MNKDTSGDSNVQLANHYNAIWEEAAPVVRGGEVCCDPWLRRRAADVRRGITLIAWPSAEVISGVRALLQDLRRIEPDQYYPPETDLHHTVLSLFTATADYHSHLAQISAYMGAASEAVGPAKPFSILFQGVTLSTSAVLAQGFPSGPELTGIRTRLRTALMARGLNSTLDERYRLVTAHMTLVRFTQRLRTPEKFVDAVSRARSTYFGTSSVRRLELVLGDWYHTSAHEQTLARYELGD